MYGNGSSAVTITVNNPTQTSMLGGLYFPNAPLNFGGNTLKPSTCLVLVARSIAFQSFKLNTASCKTYGTTLATTQGVRIVQ
jgi:hypothetical protein